jgi:hypothetical protein
MLIRKTKTILYALLLLLFVSCNDVAESKKTIKTDGHYQLEIPSSYEENTELTEDASLQYQNIYKDIYVIVIDEKKELFNNSLGNDSIYADYTPDLEGYSNLIADNLRTKLGIDTMPAMQDIKIKGLNAKLLSFNGVSDGYAIYWKAAFIEGKKRYYQINTWTNEDNKDLHENEMMEMINSFREIDKSKY